MTFYAAEFHWSEIIQVVTCQYGQTLGGEPINGMDWNAKVNCLKRNPVTVVRQIDYGFKKLWGKVIFCGMHPFGQILNFDNQIEFQNRGTEHMHAPIHMVDAMKFDENEDSEVFKFIDKCITCALLDETKYPEMSNLVKKMQIHHLTTTLDRKRV